MSLLFDENLSDELVGRLSDIFPGSSHIKQVGLERRNDEDIWEFAKQNGFTIVSKDGDFHQLSFLQGPPPKVIWLRVGNCTTSLVERMLRQHADRIQNLHDDPNAAILIVDRGPRMP